MDKLHFHKTIVLLMGVVVVVSWNCTQLLIWGLS